MFLMRPFRSPSGMDTNRRKCELCIYREHSTLSHRVLYGRRQYSNFAETPVLAANGKYAGLILRRRSLAGIGSGRRLPTEYVGAPAASYERGCSMCNSNK